MENEVKTEVKKNTFWSVTADIAKGVVIGLIAVGIVIGVTAAAAAEAEREEEEAKSAKE